MLDKYRDEALLYDLYCIECDTMYNNNDDRNQDLMAIGPTECPNCLEEDNFGPPGYCVRCRALVAKADDDAKYCNNSEEEWWSFKSDQMECDKKIEFKPVNIIHM